MKKTFLTFLVILITISGVYAQTPSVTVYNPPIPLNNPLWANGDLVVSSTEPFGRPSGTYRTSNSSIYIAVPDTNILAGKCLVLLRSTNNGTSWSVQNSVSPAAIMSKTKMVNAGNDSIYCFFQLGTTVYCWNIITNNFHVFPTYSNIRDFDATASSTHSLYLAIDLNTNNDVRVYGSSDGGTTWPTSIYMSSAGAIPRIYMSVTGDTCILNYYYNITADTGSSAIRNWRLRESAPGTLATIAGTDVITAGTFKDQFQPVIYAGKAWLFYTTGTTGSINLNCIQSDNNGSTYGTPFTIGALTGHDEYWFDAKHFIYGTGGVDLIYYSDSLGTPATNITDRLYYSYINYGTPTSYGTPVQISQHWPFWSGRLYIPSIIEYNNPAGDMGAIWVGGPSPYKLYYDGYNLTTRINNNHSEIPVDYSLGQNYPNPFNPVTKIDFSIPKNGTVTLKIYDLLGKEVVTLIDKEMNSGNYTVDFDASKLSSGTYFYKLTSGMFSQTRKMLMIK